MVSQWSSAFSFTTVADMLYNVEDIEDQIIATLKASTFLASLNADIRTHAGELTPANFTRIELGEGVIPRVPLVYVQYQGRKYNTSKKLFLRVFYINQSMKCQEYYQQAGMFLNMDVIGWFIH